jgi:hypothetical protein
VLTVGKNKSIAIPKRWKEVYYDKELRAHSFQDAHATTLTLYFFPANAITLYKEGSSDQEFLDAYLANFLKDFRESELTADTVQDQRATDTYILFQVQSLENAKDQATVLFGVKHGMLYDFRCTPTTWSQQDVNTFLVKLFLEN